MINDKKIGVVIATSMGRLDSLFSRSLQSVLHQTVQPDCIVVVDDNNEASISLEIENRINSIGKDHLYYIKNTGTKNMSGTGAWNSGIDFLKNKIGSENYIAILDDDDSWDREYLATLYQNLKESPKAVFAFLKRSDCSEPLSFQLEDLTINNFLVGDPGIQGSNMCFKIESITSIGGFDEELASCTDRDLMIRFLYQYGNTNIKIIPHKLVNHFAGKDTVTSNFEKKRTGLNHFYSKHIKLFNYPVLEKSLKRAEKLFHYPETDAIRSFWRQNKVVLITGVCGFIGSNVARKFIQYGYKVVGVDNLYTGVMNNIIDYQEADNFTFYHLSINDPIGIKKIFEDHKPDYIFHFAALPRIKYSIDHPSESYTANVEATKILAEIVAQSKAKLFVFASSSSVYGQGNGYKLSENNYPAPISPYATQKLEAENILKRELSNNSACHLIITRLFNVYGFSAQPINSYSTLIGKQISSIFKDNSVSIHGDGMQRRDFTYIDDVVSSMIYCVEQYQGENPCEIINIGTGNNYSVNDIFDILQSYFRRKIARNHVQLDYTEPNYTLADNQKAKRLLNWTPETDIHTGIDKTLNQIIANQEIIIGVAMHNNAYTIRRCLLSILKQSSMKRRLGIILANDNSSDNWQEEIADILHDQRITTIHLSNNNAVQTRNAINQFIQANFPQCVLIGRLDADDEYSSIYELAKIEAILDTENPDLISAGNYLRENGEIITRTNLADKRLTNTDYLLSRLKQMSDCVPEGELPSCNLFVKPDKLVMYPAVESGEDHALFVYYLLNQDRYKIHFAEDLLPVIYDLGGNATSHNKFSGNYIRCRKELYLKTLELCKTKNV